MKIINNNFVIYSLPAFLTFEELKAFSVVKLNSENCKALTYFLREINNIPPEDRALASIFVSCKLKFSLPLLRIYPKKIIVHT